MFVARNGPASRQAISTWGIFALAAPASAATFYVNTDLTIVTDIVGDETLTTPDDANGTPGGPAIHWAAANIDVIIASGLTMAGGAGGPGGADVSNTGGKLGAIGGAGLLMGFNAGTVTGSGFFVYGGAGGAGSGGGTGGASDTSGGNGGDGGNGFSVSVTTGNQILLTSTTVLGGVGGSGGAAGNAPGAAANTAQGGFAGTGGAGIVLVGTDTIVTLNDVTLTGGDGGAGGASLANATNRNGGQGGRGISNVATNTTITLGTGTTVQGGAGGAAGTGGTGGTAGSGGIGIFFGGTGGSLANQGTILGGGNASALVVGGTPSLVGNEGTIGAASGHTGSAVVVNSGATIASFSNAAGGLIQSTGSNNTVQVNAGATVTTFANQGSIINSGSGNGVRLGGSIGSFSNSGTIHATGGNALVIDSANAPNLIDNTGGTISSSGAGAPTIVITADMGAAGITFDGGTISHTPGGSAISVAAAQMDAVTIKNAIVGSSITFDNADETLNVSGVALNGAVLFSGGSNNLNFDVGGTTTLSTDGQAQAIGTLLFNVLAGANVISNAEQNALNSGITKLTTVATSNLLLNQNFWVDDAVYSQGTIEIAAGKTLSANEVNGDGVYVFGITDAATVAKIETQGAFSELNLTGATIWVKLTDPSAMFVSGTNFLLAEDLNGNAIAGVTDGSLAGDNSALLSFVLYRGDAAEIGLTSDLLYAQVQPALLADIAGEGDDPNSIALGATLDEIGLDGDADLDDLMLALAMLPTNEDINAVLDALLPETDGIAYDIATDMGDQALDVASKRLDTLLADRLGAEYRVASAAPVGLRGSVREGAGRFWVQGFGRAVDQSRHKYNTGYDAGSVGFALGADANLNKATAVGAAFSYASTDADGNGVNFTDTEVDSYQLTLYGDHLFGNAVYAKGLLAYGWHANDIARHNVGRIPGNTATGSYDADHVTVRAELGRAYKAGGALTLLPRVHANAAWYSPGGYSEQGVGGLGLTVAPEDLTSVRLGLGVLARWDVALSGGELFQPELRLDYRRDLTRERFETVSEFLGAPGITFVTQGVEPPADILNIGVGAVLATAGGVDFRASYDVELKDDYVAHAGYVRASVPF